MSSRESYRQTAVDSIAQSYAGAQSIVGPVIVQAYQDDVTTSRVNDKGTVIIEHSQRDGEQYSFPKDLKLNGTLIPSERHHGLYRVTVYELRAHLEADFLTPPPTENRHYGDTTLRFALSDVRGIVGLPVVSVNGSPLALRQGASADIGTGLLRSVLLASLPVAALSRQIRMDFVLGGTQQLAIAPMLI